MEREGFVILDVKIEEFPSFPTFSDSEYCIGRHNNFFVGRGGEEAMALRDLSPQIQRILLKFIWV